MTQLWKTENIRLWEGDFLFLFLRDSPHRNCISHQVILSHHKKIPYKIKRHLYTFEIDFFKNNFLIWVFYRGGEFVPFCPLYSREKNMIILIIINCGRQGIITTGYLREKIVFEICLEFCNHVYSVLRVISIKYLGLVRFNLKLAEEISTVIKSLI